MLLPLLSKTKFRFYITGFIVSVLMLGLFSGVDNGVLFKASTLNSITHDPFDGTTYPFSQSVDWVNMTSAEREMSFRQIPDSKKIPPVPYVPSHLSKDFASLGFDSSDKDIRNEKITYTVPYMGDYSLSGKEFAGSHVAVDIVMPDDTPIIAIANGIVTQVKDQSYGFGKSIVILHRNVPDPEGSGLVDLYSSYSHLGAFDVEEFQTVRKGDVIGYSGHSGNASVAHTHFQVDREEAPWYPYWPFTVAEQNAAGYTFFEAINNGLGKANGIQNTVNPLAFVQDNLSSSRSVAKVVKPVAEVAVIEDVRGSAVDEVATPVVSKVKEPKKKENVVVIKDVEPVEIEEKNVFKPSDEFLPKVSIIAPRKMIVGSTYGIKLRVNDLDNDFASTVPGNYKFAPSLLSVYSLPEELDFTKDVVFPFEPKEAGDLEIVIDLGGLTVTVSNIEVKLFTDLSVNDADLKAISYLKNKGIINGYDDDTFRPDNIVTRAEAVKVLTSILPNNYADLGNANCKDVSSSSWFGEYFETAFDMNAIIPNDNGDCRPMDEVSGYEYLKMLMTSVDVDPVVDGVYAEYFDINAWYAPYLQEAMERNIITSQDAVEFAKPMSRRGIAELTFRFLQVAESKYDVFG